MKHPDLPVFAQSDFDYFSMDNFEYFMNIETDILKKVNEFNKNRPEIQMQEDNSNTM